MTEHVHEWTWLSGYSKEQKAHISGIMCLCGAQLSLEEATKRLNEYETLKRATVKLPAGVVKGISSAGMSMKTWHALQAYADTLEGK